MKRLAALLCALWALASGGAPALAAIGTPTNTGQAINTSTVTTNYIPTTVDSPAGAAIIVVISSSASSAYTVTDTASNTYSCSALSTWNSTHKQLVCYSPNPVDLPAPVTATGSITTTTVTFTTNPGTLVVNQAITGSGVTALTQITGGISQWNGSSASATVNNSQTVVSETLTVSSTITASWTTGAKPAMAAISVSGLDLSAPLDITGTINTGTGTSASVATGTLAQANEIVIGALSYNNTPGTFTEASGFTSLTQPTQGSNDNTRWAYQIVAATTTVTYAPSWVTSRAFGANVYTFKQAGSSSAVAPRALLLGVGN